MMHDSAVTRSHVIFFECPMIFDITVRHLLPSSRVRKDASAVAANSPCGGCCMA